MADNRINLNSILNDLWGSTDALAAENARRLNDMTRELAQSGDIVVPEVPAGAEAMSPVLPGERPAAPAAQPPVPEKKAEKPAFPPFEEFWKLADESVDWTDALSYEHPQSEGIDEEHWAFLHEHAAKVLDGDLPTYLEVLKKTNPLGNVRPYARGFVVRAENADRVAISFEGLEEYLTGDDQADRHYLAGISLRCARDLMAVLPVREAAVTAKEAGEDRLTVTFTRGSLLKVRFSFLDPVAFVESCGGQFIEKQGEEAEC